MNDMIELNTKGVDLAKLNAMFGPPEKIVEETGQGVADSFAVVSFRGKVWRIKYKGQEKALRNADGDAVGSIYAVVLRSSPHVSKIFYKKAYEAGDDRAPDCFSTDGIKPDDASSDKQSATCAACPHNVFGSRITESGSKAKACSDNRRLAIVPYKDLRNESFGGPMLLRVPPTSLTNWKEVGEKLARQGINYQAVVMRLSFADAEYPQIVFRPTEMVPPEDLETVAELMKSPALDRIFGDSVVPEHAESEAKPEAKPEAEPEPEPEPEAEHASEPEPEPEQEPKAEKQSAKEANAATASEVDAEVASLIGDLLD